MSIIELRNFIEASNDDIILSKTITEMGIHRSYLTKLCRTGELKKIGCGVYIKSSAWEDEFYILQSKYKNGIFSHETALYLHGLTDRTPIKYTMTFPHGYSTDLLEKENINKKRVIKEKYNIGIIEVVTPFNNKVKTYDVERTLCDIVKGKGIDVQIINDAMKRYVNSKEKNINKLLEYSEILRVKPKILKYMEVLL